MIKPIFLVGSKCHFIFNLLMNFEINWYYEKSTCFHLLPNGFNKYFLFRYPKTALVLKYFESSPKSGEFRPFIIIQQITFYAMCRFKMLPLWSLVQKLYVQRNSYDFIPPGCPILSLKHLLSFWSKHSILRKVWLLQTFCEIN